MSHFTVMVIGDDVEGQLAPYDENLAVPKYKDGEVSHTDITRFLEYYKKKENFDGTIEEGITQFGDDWNGDSWEKDENGVLCRYSTYNPKSKWDWYTVGGRWMGFFKLKDSSSGELGKPGSFDNKPKENTADILLKKDIDFDSMRDEAAKIAAVEYDIVFEAIKDTQVNESWEIISERFGRNQIDAAREFYHGQERVKVFNELKKSNPKIFSVFDEVEKYTVDREIFIETARNSAISTYALVKDGEWYERGNMGWFGISTNEQDESTWNKFVNKTLDELPDNTRITLVDCHI